MHTGTEMKPIFLNAAEIIFNKFERNGKHCFELVFGDGFRYVMMPQAE